MTKRALLVLATLVAFASSGAASVSGAEPELGATVQALVYADEDRDLSVINRSNVEAAFEFVPSQGWRVEPIRLVLAPGEQSAVRVTELGFDGATVEIRVASTAPTPEGTQRGEIAFEAILYTERPVDHSYLLIATALSAVLVAVGGHRLWKKFPRRAGALARTGG